MKLQNTFREGKEPQRQPQTETKGGTTYCPPERAATFQPKQLNVPKYGERLSRTHTAHIPFMSTIECLVKGYK